MLDVRNVAKARLEAGELALGLGLRQARTVEIAKALGTCGYDWLFIDMEHNSMSMDTAAQISVAAQDAGITPIVRVPGFEHHLATRALDGGAQGVVVPHVDSVETARRIASQCRYPPIGHRSIYSALPQTGFEAHPVGDIARAINDSTLVVAMIETPEALADVEAIAAVEGIDCLLVGAADLTLEMGIPGKVDHPQVQVAMERVVAACHAHGKHAGLGGVYDPPLMERYIGMGMRFILCGNDLAMMMAAARQRTGFLRALKL